jgi:predicted aspartyl protease
MDVMGVTCRAFLLGLLLAVPLAGSALAGCAASHVADAPLTFDDGFIFVPVTMNGATGHFLLDSGSAETLVDSAYASRAGVGMDRRAGTFIYRGAGNKETLPGFHGHVRMTEFGSLHFQDWEYAILDLSWQSTAGGRTDGILGMDFLHYFDVAIDFQKRIVSLYRLSDCKDIAPPWKGDYDAIPLKHTPDHNLTLPVFVDNTLLDMMFDTGAGSGVMLTRDAAARAGADGAALARDVAGHSQGVGGEFHVVRHRFASFLLGSAVYKDHVLAVENERSDAGETDGLIGLGPLDAQRIWISFATNTLFVQRASQAK